MAIIDTNTKEYFKLDFDNCFANNNVIKIAYFVYPSLEEREKEKQRMLSFSKFEQNVLDKQNTLLNEIEFLQKNKDNIEENVLIDKAKQLATLNNFYFNLKEQLYGTGQKREYSSEEEDLLVSLEGQLSWLSQQNPIKGHPSIFYNNQDKENVGELEDYNFYYNILKLYMNDNFIIDN